MAETDTFLFTSKSANEGHPDKLCDQISDAVLDTCLEHDLDINVTNEIYTKTNMDVEENLEIGMMFDTLEIAYNYFNSYAQRIEFSVRKRTNISKYDPNIIDSQTLYCSCEGSYEKNQTLQKNEEKIDDSSASQSFILIVSMTDLGYQGSQQNTLMNLPPLNKHII